MKTPRILTGVLVVTTSIVILTACSNVKTHLVAPKSSFIAEQDEPSFRGRVTRTSPEQSYVSYRFDISPDGKHIILSGVQAGGGDNLLQLWQIAADGTGSPIKITSGGDNNYFYPSYTSDGNFIVYESGRQLWKVKSDGTGGKMRIPGTGTNSDTAPCVSSKDRLVFNSVQISNIGGLSNKKYLIWTSNLDGGELTQIREGTNPRWSPDGSKIIFEFKGDIWTVKTDGTDLMNLTTTSYVQEDLPSFSPDGKQIVYTSNESKGGMSSEDWNVWIMNIDGSNRQQLTELKSWDMWPIWGSKFIYFLSSRGQTGNQRIQRIWKLTL